MVCFRLLRSWKRRRRQNKELDEWRRNGGPASPPHHYKQQVLRTFARKYGLRTFVETGTFNGDMVEAMRGVFDRIYTIELGKDLYERAKKRFEHDPTIEVIHGDSGIELATLADRLTGPALFWLDAHYSAGVTARSDKDTPIYEELSHILDGRCSGHVIVIDDARLFGVDAAYPSIEELTRFVRSKRPGCAVTVEDDSIRIVAG